MKQITINYQGKAYTLEFTKATAGDFIRQGFEPADIFLKAPLATIPFVYSAFKSKHPTINRKKVEEIYSEIPANQKTALLGALNTMFTDTYTSLIGDENGSDEGNATWEQNWDGE